MAGPCSVTGSVTRTVPQVRCLAALGARHSSPLEQARDPARDQGRS